MFRLSSFGDREITRRLFSAGIGYNRITTVGVTREILNLGRANE